MAEREISDAFYQITRKSVVLSRGAPEDIQRPESGFLHLRNWAVMPAGCLRELQKHSREFEEKPARHERVPVSTTARARELL